MAIDSNPRRFVLVVSEVNPLFAVNGELPTEDEVSIVYLGKVTPAMRKRIERALRNTLGANGRGLEQTERRLI
jgi:hypothetical protein